MTKEYDEICNLEYSDRWGYSNEYLFKKKLIISVCKSCEQSNKQNDKFCRNCGCHEFKEVRIVSVCNYCERLLDYEEDYCSICGHKANSPKLTEEEMKEKNG